MDATQMIDDPILESEEEEEDANKRGEPLAKLRVLKNEHIPETELPLYVGENVLGRDPNTCSLPLLARSVSKRHTVISISVFRGNGRRGEAAMEALVWDLGSMNGTRRGRFKLTPHVRYALSEGDGLLVADIPCQYVSYAVNEMAGQRDIKSPVNRDSGSRGRDDVLTGMAQLHETSRDQGLGRNTNADSEKHTNGNIITSAPPPSSDGEESGKTPVRTKTLSLEQTPTQPEGTLVPPSDSDSDGERGGRRDRWVKAVVSDSDSQMSSPACSTSRSPTNKVIQESVNESPITPSSSTKNRPKKRVSFSSEERDVNVGRQQLKRKRAQVIVDDSDEDQEEGKEERAARGGGGESVENGKGEVSVEQANDVSPSAGDGLPVSTPAITADALPAFNMDSDTDAEGEEEVVVAVASAVPVTLNAPPADPPTDLGQFHMDSDTDVDESDDALDSGPKPVPASNDNSKPNDFIPAVHSADLNLDSDTDRDDDDDDDDAAAAAVSDTATKSRATSVESVNTADSGPSTQPKDFHHDSDTDLEEDKDDSRSKDANSNIDETHSRVDPNSSRVESTSAPQNLQLNSDTDDEGIPVAPVSSKPTGVATDAKPPTSADTGADLEILSDSDTDLEEDGPLLPPAVAAATTAAPPSASMSAATVATAAGPQSESDTDTDVEKPLVPPAGVLADPHAFRMDSDTVGEEEACPRKAVEGQTPGLSGEKACRLLRGSVPSILKCSTPVGLSGPQPPALRPVVSSSDSQEDDDFIVAETQSFVLESRDCQGNCPVDPTLDATQAFSKEPSSGDEQEEESSRAGSFQLGLSDSSHPLAGALASESTQAFVTFDGDGDLEATQAYGTAPPTDGASLEEDSELEATQAYGGNDKRARRSAVFEKEGQVDFALEATQAYVPEPHSDTEDDREERVNIANAETVDMSAYTGAEEEETQPFDLPTRYNVATAETQPMSALEEEDEEEEDPVGAIPPPLRRGRSIRQKERDEREEDGEATQPQEVLTKQYLVTAETQPMDPCDDEDSIPGPRKRRAKSRRLVEEETQPFNSSELSTAETQPMFTPDDEDDGEGDGVVAKPPSPKRRGRSRRGKVEEEETQPFVTSAHISTAETQPLATTEIDEEEEEEEETKAGPQKAKGRPQRGKGRESEAGTRGISSRGRRGRGEGEKEEEEEPAEPPQRQTRGKGKATSTVRGRRGKVRPEEEESEEEEVERVQRGRGGKSFKQRRDEREEGERLQREQKEERLERTEHTEEDRLHRGKEEKAAKEREEKERTERELKEQEERERLEKERREREERERMEREIREQEERERLEKERREEQKRLERERKEKEEQERLEQERREKEERERLEREKAEREEKERLERENERVERERKEREEKERLERMRKEKEEQERLEKEKEERERMEREKREQEERERLEKERREEQKRLERERKEKEEQERLEQERREKEERERLEREKAEREEKERLERENERVERERKEREEKERLERMRKEKEELERLERENKEKEEREEKERLEREKEHLVKEAVEKQLKEQQEKQDQVKSEDNKPTTSARGGRAGRRTIAAPSTAEPESDLNISTAEDVPARRTRSRSNSSNSVSSERSSASVHTQGSRGRGRGSKRASQPAGENATRASNRRRMMAGEPPAEKEDTGQDIVSSDVPAPGTLARSSSLNSLNSEVSSSSVASQNRGRGRGGRGRGRGRKTGPEPVPAPVPPTSSQSDQPSSAPKATARGRKSRRVEDSTTDASQAAGEDKAGSQQPNTTTRGRARAKDCQPTVANEEVPTSQVEESSNEDSLLPKGGVKGRGRGQKAIKVETVETAVAAVGDGGDEVKERERGKGRKRELEEEEEEEESSGAKFVRGTAKARRGIEAAEEEKVEQQKETPAPVSAKRRGRASTAQGKKNAKQEVCATGETKEESEKMEEGTVERKARGRQSVAQKKKEEEREDSTTTPSNSMDQDASVETSKVPQTPTGNASWKRATPADSSPVAKTPRSSSASPGTVNRLRAASQTYKVLFTGVVDEAGEKVVCRLGGSMAKGVADMTCLVTDKVRRTVKFLCAVARGVPVVTTHWLDMCGKAGSFLSPNAFIVKDAEQEKKFDFCLQESLRTASNQPLLQGYEIHVTKSVKPEPVQMKDIIICSGASVLPKMPSVHKAQTVVISCEEDWSLCGPAVSASLPVVTAEFILTGILQQKIDLKTHTLPAPASNTQSVGGRGRGRKKT